MKSFVGKAASVVASPNFPSTAALFHSTPFLSLKKRVYWPERSYRRGPPRAKYDFVFEKVKVPVIDELSFRFPTTNWKCEDPDEKSENFSKRSDQSSHSSSKSLNKAALSLGLHAAGPLNIQDVKIAYRSCALKWHPDLHPASTKAFAEEKFKKCKAAYQSLCDQLSSSS